MHIFVKSSADPRLLGAVCKTLSPAGGSWVECCDWDERMDETYAFVRVSFRLESRSRKALEKQCLFCGSVCFQLIFLSQASNCTTSTLHEFTNFYVERVTAHAL